MPFLNLATQKTKEIWPQVFASVGHSDKMTVARVALAKGAVVGEHKHPHEQWTIMIEGELEFTLSGTTEIVRPGMVVHIPSNEPHSVKALSASLAMDVFCPVREDFK